MAEVICNYSPSEVSGKRKAESIDEVPHVTNSPFLAEKQDVERVAKIQKAESKEGKPHGTTNPSLAEKQEIETAKKPHSENKNEEVAKSVESPEASKNTSDSDDDDEQWPLLTFPDETLAPYPWEDGYGDSDSDDETYKKWIEENEDRYNDSDCDSDDEMHKKCKEENED